MSITNFRVVNFGKNKTGLSTVGYSIFNTAGSLITGRTTAGVFEVSASSGCYGAQIPFSASFSGSIFWSTDTSNNPSVAIEEYNFLNVNPSVEDNKTILTQISGTLGAMSGSIDFIAGVTGGRWRVVANQLILYRSDNTTILATFNLFDSTATPTSTNPADRQRV